MKSIIITGSTSGIGYELTNILKKLNDYDLICYYRSLDKFNNLFIGNANIKGIKFDNYKYNKCTDFITEKSNELYLILTAFTILPIKRFGNYSCDEIDEIINVNIRFNTQILNDLVKFCKSKKILLTLINFDSGAADFALKGWSCYCAGKSYINALLSSIREENPDYNIVSFDPGVVDTSMQEEIRKTPNSIFDRVGDFVEYKVKCKLHNPYDVAMYVYNNYIQTWNAKSMRERYKV